MSDLDCEQLCLSLCLVCPQTGHELFLNCRRLNLEYCFRFQQELYRELISIKSTFSSVWATESIFLSKMSDIYFCSFTNSFLLSKNIIKNLKFQSNLYDPGPVTNGPCHEWYKLHSIVIQHQFQYRSRLQADTTAMMCTWINMNF